MIDLSIKGIEKMLTLSEYEANLEEAIEYYQQTMLERQAIETLIDPEVVENLPTKLGIGSAIEIVSNIQELDLNELPSLSEAIDWYDLEQVVAQEKINEAKEDLSRFLLEQYGNLITYVNSRLSDLDYIIEASSDPDDINMYQKAHEELAQVSDRLQKPTSTLLDHK